MLSKLSHSLYYMKDKDSVCLYSSNTSKIRQLTSSDFILIEKCITLLQIFEEITKKLSFHSSSISQVIPFIVSLKTLHQTSDFEAEEGIKSAVQTINSELTRRFDNLERNFLYSIATYLDARYKGKFFTTSYVLKEVQEEITKQWKELSSEY